MKHVKLRKLISATIYQLLTTFLVLTTIYLLLTTVLLLTIPTVVNAQSVDLSVNPPHIEALMKPDVSLISAITIENFGDPVVLTARVVSFEPAGDQGDRVFKDKAEGPLRFSLENADLALGEPFFLPQKKHRQLLLKIRTIENATNGDYYYTLFFKTEPPVSDVSAGRGSAEIGANILISISDTGFLTTEGKIAQFQIVPRYKFNFFGKRFEIVEPGDEVPVILKIANVGHYLVVPDATVSLQGPYGIHMKQKMVGVNVLKQSERLLTQEEQPDCKRCTIPVSTVFHGFFLGKYALNADISYQNAQQKVFASTEFWALPISLTKIAFGLFCTSALLLIVFRHKR